MLLSPRKNGLTSLFKEVRVFKARGHEDFRSDKHKSESNHREIEYLVENRFGNADPNRNLYLLQADSTM